MPHPSIRAMHWIALTTAGCLSAVVCAGLAFGPTGTIAVGPNPEGLAVADFNGDGNLDFAVSTDNPDRVQVFFGNGSGAFAPGPVSIMPAGSGVGRLVAARLDGGATVDLGASFQNTGSVAILLNNGTGAFAISGTFGVGANPRGIDAADIDGDTDMDLAVANRDGNSVSILTNTGAGFTVVTLPVGIDPRDAAFGDIDNDNDPDLVVSNNDSDSLSLFRNTAGVFALTATLQTGPPLSPEGVVFGHFNADNNLDIAAATSGNNLNRVSVFLNTGGGVYGAPSHFAAGGVDPSDMAARDFDCDGDIDIAVTQTASNNITIMQNNGLGSFAASTTLAAGLSPQEIVSADFSAGGGPDIIAVNGDAGSVTTAMNLSCPTCPGDTNGDNIVNFADLNIVLSQFGMSGAGLSGDVNGDNVVNFADLNIVLSHFGTIC